MNTIKGQQSNAVFASHLTSCTLLTRPSIQKWTCRVGFKAYKRRLVYSVTVGIGLLNISIKYWSIKGLKIAMCNTP